MPGSFPFLELLVKVLAIRASIRGLQLSRDWILTRCGWKGWKQYWKPNQKKDDETVKDFEKTTHKVVAEKEINHDDTE